MLWLLKITFLSASNVINYLHSCRSHLTIDRVTQSWLTRHLKDKRKVSFLYKSYGPGVLDNNGTVLL